MRYHVPDDADFEEPRGGGPEVIDKVSDKMVKPAGAAASSWRDSNNEEEIERLFPYRPKWDDIIDLGLKARKMKSQRLMALAKERQSRAEESMRRRAKSIVNQLIESD